MGEGKYLYCGGNLPGQFGRKSGWGKGYGGKRREGEHHGSVYACLHHHICMLQGLGRTDLQSMPVGLSHVPTWHEVQSEASRLLKTSRASMERKVGPFLFIKVYEHVLF
jgi:hypothetical protein